MILASRIQRLRDRWERLSQRERTLVTAFGVSFVVMTSLIVAVVVTDGLTEMGERNTAMRQALRDLETQRESYLRAKAKVSQIEARIGHTPVQLTGYLETAAKEAGVEIPESNERPTVPSGSKWTERSVDLRLRKVTLESLANFLNRVETGTGLVVVTALNVRARDDKRQEFDVELSVSTYEHAGEKKDKPGKKGDKT
jgi:type II secretory pathway component PulM